MILEDVAVFGPKKALGRSCNVGETKVFPLEQVCRQHQCTSIAGTGTARLVCSLHADGVESELRFRKFGISNTLSVAGRFTNALGNVDGRLLVGIAVLKEHRHFLVLEIFNLIRKDLDSNINIVLTISGRVAANGLG